MMFDKTRVASDMAKHTVLPNITFIGIRVWDLDPETIKIGNYCNSFAPANKFLARS